MQQFLALKAIQGVESVTDDCYSRTFIIETDEDWFRVSTLQGENDLKVEMNLPNIEKSPTVLSNIERVFDLNADTNTIQTQLLKSSMLKKKMFTGLRIHGV